MYKNKHVLNISTHNLTKVSCTCKIQFNILEAKKKRKKQIFYKQHFKSNIDGTDSLKFVLKTRLFYFNLYLVLFRSHWVVTTYMYIYSWEPARLDLQLMVCSVLKSIYIKLIPTFSTCIFFLNEFQFIFRKWGRSEEIPSILT